MSDANLKVLTTDIVAAMVASNAVEAAALPQLITSVHDALAGLGKDSAAEAAAPLAGAVSARKSLADPEKIISMINGKPYSTLKRHLARHGLTPAEYRQRFGLKHDYPMVAPGYAARRSEISKSIGFGLRDKPNDAADGAAEPKPKRKILKLAHGVAEDHADLA